MKPKLSRWALSLVLLALAAPVWAKEVPGLNLYLPAAVTDSGRQIDSLYHAIMAIVIVIFVITEGMLIYSLIAFRDRPGHKARFFHGSTSVELILSVIPALILTYITVASGQLWRDIRYHPPKSPDAVHVQVLAEQFAWNFRYAGADGKFGTHDDIQTFNELGVPAGKDVILHLSASDVIHSFFIPEARVKTDTVPGLIVSIWFNIDHQPVWDREAQKRVLLSQADYAANEVAVSGYSFGSTPRSSKGAFYQVASSDKIGLLDFAYTRDAEAALEVVKNNVISKGKGEPKYIRHHYEIACAQLCGASHFAMRGEVLVLGPAEYERWMKAKAAEAKDDTSLGEKWAGFWDKFHPEYNQVL